MKISFQHDKHGTYTATPYAVDAARAYFDGMGTDLIRHVFRQNYGQGSVSGGQYDAQEFEDIPRSGLMVMAGEWQLGLHEIAEKAREWMRGEGIRAALDFNAWDAEDRERIARHMEWCYPGGWDGFLRAYVQDQQAANWQLSW